MKQSRHRCKAVRDSGRSNDAARRTRPLTASLARSALAAAACTLLGGAIRAQCDTVIDAPGPVPNSFGGRVAVSNGRILATDKRNFTFTLFSRDGTGAWQPEHTNGCSGMTDSFGASVALWSDDCADVAQGESSVVAYIAEPDVPFQSPNNYGWVVPYWNERVGSDCSWGAPFCPLPVQHPSLISDGARFGASIDVDEMGTLIVGAPGNDLPIGSDAGSAHLYLNGSYSAPLDLRTLATEGQLPPEGFGSAVAFDGDWILVGSTPSFLTSTQSYDVSVFHRTSGVWSFWGSIPANGPRFGGDIVLSDARAFIRSGTLLTQFVYREYVFSMGNWTETGFALPAGSLDFDGELLVKNGSGFVLAGCGGIAPRLYALHGSEWAEIGSLPGTVGGTAVAVDDGLVVAGSPAETGCCVSFGCDPSAQDGAVHVHEVTTWNAGGSTAAFEPVLNWTSGSPVGRTALIVGASMIAATCELTTAVPQVVCALRLEGDVDTSSPQRLHVAQGSKLQAEGSISVGALGVLQLEGSGSGSTSVEAERVTLEEGGIAEGHGEVQATTIEIRDGAEVRLDDQNLGLAAELTLDTQTLDLDGGIKVDRGGRLTIPNAFTNDGAIFVDGGAAHTGDTLFSSAAFTNTAHQSYPYGGFFVRNADVLVGDPGITNADAGYVEFEGECYLTSHVANEGVVLVKDNTTVDMQFSDLTNAGQVVIQVGGELTCFSYSVPPGSGGVLWAAPGDCLELDPATFTLVPCSPSLAPLGAGGPAEGAGASGGGSSLEIIGDLTLPSDATLDFAGGTIRLLGDFDVAIADEQRFDFLGAKLQLDGLGFFGAQELEVCGPDLGPQTDYTNASLFPMGVLQLGPTPAAVKLVDDHVNSSGNEALYAAHVIVENGCELDLAGRKLYCARLDVASGGSVTDSVGGGSLVQTSGGTFCNAVDGALEYCLCDNPGLPNTGCENAQGTGGALLQLDSQGTSSATLVTEGLPTQGSPGVVLIRADDTEDTPVTFGDGLRCVGLTNTVRLGATQADAGTGMATHTFGHGAGSGQFFYQAWYRNLPAGYCNPEGFNLSNGVTLVW